MPLRELLPLPVGSAPLTHRAIKPSFQNYQTAYGIEPDVWAAQSYATVYILAKAIADAQSADPNAIRDALANITDFDTILGKFSFNAVGDAVYDPIVLIVKDGEFQVFE